MSRRHSNPFLSLATLLAVASLTCRADGPDLSKIPPPVSRPVDFVKEVFPIFRENCIKCHGPEKHKGDYRMDTREAAFKAGKGGPNIVPGDSARSPLIQMVAGLIEDDLMPPP